MASSERKVEIVETVMGLLADTPLEQMSTRCIARAVGVSQPALFRHFRNREALLLAVIDEARDELASSAEEVFRTHAAALPRIRAMVAAYMAHVERNPGLPRLLFANAGAAADPVSAALRHLLAMQRALLGQLVYQGQAEGSFAAEIDPGQAALALIGALQATVLHWQMEGRRVPLSEQADGVLSQWQVGALPRDGAPVTAVPGAVDGQCERARDAEPTLRLIDVRPMIAQGNDPFHLLRAALEEAPAGSILIIRSSFFPRPLVALMETSGHGVAAEEARSDLWDSVVTILGPPVDDLRDLEAPEPLERVLQAVSGLAPGQRYGALLPRRPRLLPPHLAERGLSHRLLDRSELGVVLLVWRPA